MLDLGVAAGTSGGVSDERVSAFSALATLLVALKQLAPVLEAAALDGAVVVGLVDLAHLLSAEVGEEVDDLLTESGL
jgi:hypothetical protein